MVRGASRRGSGSFGSSPSASKKSRGERLRDRYSTDRYPTPEDFIRAVEENPEHFDPGSMDQGKFRYEDSGNGRGVGYSDLKGSNKSNWIGDNPIDVDIDTDPGSISVSSELWNNEEGDSVSVVAGLDLVPMGIDINVNGDVGTIAVDLGMPGDAIGVTIGGSIDLETGEVIGGQIGLAGGGLSVNVNQIRKDGETCTTITVTYFGIGTSYQRCRKDDDDDEKDPKKDPPPDPPKGEDDLDFPKPPPTPFIPGDPDTIVAVLVGQIQATTMLWSRGYGSEIRKVRYSNSPNNINLDAFTVDTNHNFIHFYSGYVGDQPYSWLEIQTGSGPSQYSETGVAGSYWAEHWKALGRGAVGFRVIKIGDMNATIANNYSGSGDIKKNIVFQGYPYRYEEWGRMTILGVWNLATKENIVPPSPDPPKEPDPPIPPEDNMSNCCNLEPVMSMLRKLNQALAVDEIVDQGLELPNEWILPTGKGHTKMQNYLQIAVFLAKMQDHLGVHPMTVQIADLSAGQDGNQEFKKYYPNGTKAIQEILTILHDENSDSADRLNLQMRLAILNTRIFVTVASIARSMRGIFQFLGTPLKEKRDVVPLPFDYTYGLRKNKGFSQNAAQDAKQLEEAMGKMEAELNKNTESATEALLAKFLNDSDQPIIFETFDNSHPDLLTLLRAVNTQLKKK